MPSSRGNSSLIIRNLNYDTRDYTLKEMFEEFGEVRDIYLPTDYNTRQPRGFGFIEFTDERDAADALEKIDGKDIDGHQVTLEWAKQRRKSPGTMRHIQRAKGTGKGRGRSRSYSRGRRGGRDRDSDRRGGRDDRRERRRERSRSRGRGHREERSSRDDRDYDREEKKQRDSGDREEKKQRDVSGERRRDYSRERD